MDIRQICLCLTLSFNERNTHFQPNQLCVRTILNFEYCKDPDIFLDLVLLIESLRTWIYMKTILETRVLVRNRI